MCEVERCLCAIRWSTSETETGGIGKGGTAFMRAYVIKEVEEGVVVIYELGVLLASISWNFAQGEMASS